MCETGVPVCLAGVRRMPQPFGSLGWGRRPSSGSVGPESSPLNAGQQPSCRWEATNADGVVLSVLSQPCPRWWFAARDFSHGVRMGPSHIQLPRLRRNVGWRGGSPESIHYGRACQPLPTSQRDKMLCSLGSARSQEDEDIDCG